MIGLYLRQSQLITNHGQHVVASAFASPQYPGNVYAGVLKKDCTNLARWIVLLVRACDIFVKLWRMRALPNR